MQHAYIHAYVHTGMGKQVGLDQNNIHESAGIWADASLKVLGPGVCRCRLILVRIYACQARIAESV